MLMNEIFLSNCYISLFDHNLFLITKVLMNKYTWFRRYPKNWTVQCSNDPIIYCNSALTIIEKLISYSNSHGPIHLKSISVVVLQFNKIKCKFLGKNCHYYIMKLQHLAQNINILCY